MLRKLVVALIGFVALAAMLSIASHIWFASRERAVAGGLRDALATRVFPADALREDVAALRALLTDVHPAAIPSFPMGDYAADLEAVAESLNDPLDHLGFYRLLGPVVNQLNDEHTMLFPPDCDDRAAGFPFDVRIHDDRILVWQDWHGDRGIARGDELRSINGVPAATIVESMSVYFSGTSARQKQTYAEWGFACALPQILDLQPPFRLEYRSAATGGVSTLEVAAIARPGQPTSAVSAFSFEVLEPEALRFTFNAFADPEGQFDAFLAEVFGTLDERKIDALIIDLRRNQGGAAEYGDRVLAYLTDQPFTQLKRVDVTVSHEVKEEFLSYVPGFIRWLPVQYFHPFLKPLWNRDNGEIAGIEFEPLAPADNALRFDGDVYVLIGPGTMSSASLFAAAIKHYQLGTLVGEPSGGFATMYGNVIDARLPNTGLKVWMPTSVVYGHGQGPVMPDHGVRATVEDIASSRDAVLEYALQLATVARQAN